MSRMPTTRTILFSALAAGALLGFAGTASATPNQAPPAPGDDRATAHQGNVVERDCAELFPGSEAVDKADLTFEVDGSATYLDITAVADGVEVAGVIVKGGPAYNMYGPDGLGALPWLDLHSPLVSSGKPAQISHWFACGVEGTETTTTTPTPPSSEAPTSSSPATEQPSSRVETTTSQDVAPAADEEELAETGFDAGWLVLLGAALLLGGGALLVLMRLRGARR